MSDSKVLIEPLVLDPADFPPLPLDPGFQQLVSDELQDTATPADGFDDIVTEVIGILDGLDSGLGALNPTLADTFAEADLIDAAPVSDTSDGFIASLDAPSASVDDLGTLLAGASPPSPPGSGNTGGGGSVAGCEFTLHFGVDDPVPQTRVAFFFNHTGRDLHITSKVFTQDVAGTFSESDTIPAVMPADTHGAISITRLTAAPLGTSCKVVVTSDSPNSPNSLCGTVAQFGDTSAPPSQATSSTTAQARTELNR